MEIVTTNGCEHKGLRLVSMCAGITLDPMYRKLEVCKCGFRKETIIPNPDVKFAREYVRSKNLPKVIYL